MKLLNCKVTAIILVIVIFASIFLIVSGNYGNSNQSILGYYPSIENIFEEELINHNELGQFFKWDKNIMFFLNMEYILFSIICYADILKIKRCDFINKLSKFNSYSIFIVLFINKEDGKKKNMFIHTH